MVFNQLSNFVVITILAILIVHQQKQGAQGLICYHELDLTDNKNVQAIQLNVTECPAGNGYCFFGRDCGGLTGVMRKCASQEFCDMAMKVENPPCAQVNCCAQNRCNSDGLPIPTTTTVGRTTTAPTDDTTEIASNGHSGNRIIAAVGFKGGSLTIACLLLIAIFMDFGLELLQ